MISSAKTNDSFAYSQIMIRIFDTNTIRIFLSPRKKAKKWFMTRIGLLIRPYTSKVEEDSLASVGNLHFLNISFNNIREFEARTIAGLSRDDIQCCRDISLHTGMYYIVPQNFTAQNTQPDIPSKTAQNFLVVRSKSLP